MSQYLEAFLLGNAAIIGNVCVLPLYPGLLAFLAGQQQSSGATKRVGQTGWLGVLVLAGVLSLMLLLGGVLYALRQSVTTILPVLLPVAYGAVFVLGILLLFGINPFKHLANIQSPILQNRYATAYLYGVLLGPMTLPCTGPLIISAFVLGAGDALALADGIAYFLAFGLGFGWPLVALALVAANTGQQLTRWFARREPIIQRLSGILLIAIALFGLQTDVLPNLRVAATPTLPADAVAVAAAMASAPSPTSRPTRVTGPSAPEITGITNWINSKPLTIADLQGQVVLIHFWTYGCYNCVNTLPHVIAWDAAYRQQGLMVIGVHSPEFQYEYESANVLAAAERFGITYPIAQDNDFVTWRAYRNRYWPTIYLIDAQGVLRYTRIGEGAYDQTEQAIQALLAERS